MSLKLTPDLLQFLKVQGYKYCYSKTTLCIIDNGLVKIILTPTHHRPRIRSLPPEFDTYFALSREPAIMAGGIDDTIVLVDMDDQLTVLYIKETLNQANAAAKKGPV